MIGRGGQVSRVWCLSCWGKSCLVLGSTTRFDARGEFSTMSSCVPNADIIRIGHVIL